MHCEELLGFSLMSTVDQLDHELELGEASYKPIYLVRGVFVNYDDAALPEFFDKRWVSRVALKRPMSAAALAVSAKRAFVQQGMAQADSD